VRTTVSVFVSALMALACVAGVSSTANAASSSKTTVKPNATFVCYQWYIYAYDLSGNAIWRCRYGAYI
jgi:hypothetical protein